MEVNFRKATKNDKKSLLELLSSRQEETNKLRSTTGNLVFNPGDKIFERMIADKNIIIIVGEKDKKIVAALTIYLLPRIRLGGYFAFFEDVLVAKDFRNKGVGRGLLSFAKEEVKKNPEIKKIKLGSRKDETGLHSFYEKSGFVFKEKLFQFLLR